MFKRVDRSEWFWIAGVVLLLVGAILMADVSNDLTRLSAHKVLALATVASGFAFAWFLSWNRTQWHPVSYYDQPSQSPCVVEAHRPEKIRVTPWNCAGMNLALVYEAGGADPAVIRCLRSADIDVAPYLVFFVNDEMSVEELAHSQEVVLGPNCVLFVACRLNHDQVHNILRFVEDRYRFDEASFEYKNYRDETCWRLGPVILARVYNTGVERRVVSIGKNKGYDYFLIWPYMPVSATVDIKDCTGLMDSWRILAYKLPSDASMIVLPGNGNMLKVRREIIPDFGIEILLVK